MAAHKAVSLLSGGLDSALACRLMLNQGIEVHAVYIEMPWGCGKISRAQALADSMGIPLKVIPLGHDYLSILKNPKHGFGSAHNPCTDCHIYMVKKAAEHMKEINGGFVFTGEVLGQRPMSQRRQCLTWVEEETGIPGRLLRPLCARHMTPTIPEQEGIVDRSLLKDFQGRSRKAQLALAKELGLQGFAQPSGGCLLTEKVFGVRVKDVIGRGCSAIQELAILGAGRFVRLSDEAFVLLGRDQKENDHLFRYAMDTDIIFRTYEFPGPTAVLRGKKVLESDLAFTAGLVQFFSRRRFEPPAVIPCWTRPLPDAVRNITAVVPDEATVKGMCM